MRLSDLQKYILLEAMMIKGSKFSRNRLISFYEKKHKDTKPEQRVKAITKSIERLIDKELLIGYGVRTSHKWFIKEVKATAKGMRVAKQMLGDQQKLPFKKRLRSK